MGIEQKGTVQMHIHLHRWGCLALLLAGICILSSGQGWSGETGHYFPGIANIRDFVVPPPGFYYLQYNGYYHSDTFRDSSGDKVDSVQVGSETIDIDADLDVWTILPTFIWSTDWKILGAQYSGFVQPSFGNISVQAAAEIIDQEAKADDSGFGMGDLYVQPVWLGWHWTHFDLSPAFGFYVPIGKYDEGATDNVGLGYWSFNFFLNGVYYPFKDQSTAVSVTGIYEINTNREGVDIRPGDHFTLEYGISQYLSERLEVGLSGYNTWQVTDDSGSDATNNGRDRMYGIGGQIAYWFVKDKFSVSARYLTQYGVKDRTEGDYGVLTLMYVF
jgi:hypothetical protein